MPVTFVASCKLPTPYGEFVMHGFEDTNTGKEHIALVLGNVADEDSVLCRVHSECLTGDCLFSMRCDCGAQFQHAMQKVSEEGKGVILYLRQEGRGIGLINKIRAYELQDRGADTVEANERLGFDADLRDYTLTKDMFLHLQIDKVRLMTNNPKKLDDLAKYGLTNLTAGKHVTGTGEWNRTYLNAKRGWGHNIEESDLV